jgi:hypothetical protein
MNRTFSLEALGGCAALIYPTYPEPGLAERMRAESLRLAREQYDVHKVNAVILNAMGL